MNPVFLTERKDALTEEMNALIDSRQATSGDWRVGAKQSEKQHWEAQPKKETTVLYQWK